MNKQDLENSYLESFLAKKKARGVPSIIYRLNSNQLDFVENVLGYKTIPFIFTIYTKKLVYRDIRNKGGLLKQISRAKQSNIPKIHRTLNHSEKKLLKEHDIFYVPYKRIILLK